MFRGHTIRIGDEDFVVPPLSLGQLRNGVLARLQEHDKILSSGSMFDALVIRGEVILQALRRNYPEFSEDKLMSYLDLFNIGPIWLAVLGSSGFTPGEDQAPKGATTVPGTSAQSTGV